MKNSILILFQLLSQAVKTHAQDKVINYPRIGEPVEDYTFSDLVNYPKNSFKISDYKGKWLILDFWSRWCSLCLASFPKMDTLRQKLEGKAEIIMIGDYLNNKKNPNDEAYTRNVFKLKAKKYRLTLPNAFDSIVSNRWHMEGLPMIMVINPAGNLSAKVIKLDSAMFSQIVEGKDAWKINEAFFEGELTTKVNYNIKMPLLVSGSFSNGGIDSNFMYRSLFSKWKRDELPLLAYGWNENELNIQNYAEATGFSLASLFRIAYTGLHEWGSRNDTLGDYFSNKLIIKSKKKSLFEINDFQENEDNMFSYSLRLPNLTSQMARQFLLNDLHRVFGLHSTVEKCDVDVLKLVVIDMQKAIKLKTRGLDYARSELKKADPKNKNLSNDPFAAIIEKTSPARRFLNFPISRLVREKFRSKGLAAMFKFNYAEVPPLVDRTGIDFNIDIAFPQGTLDWDDVLTTLRKNGLDIVNGKTEMQSIIVKDASVLDDNSK